MLVANVVVVVDEGVDVVVLVAGTGKNDKDGLEDAMLQNCCARDSAPGSSSSVHWEATQAWSSGGNLELGVPVHSFVSLGCISWRQGSTYLTQKQFTSTTLEQFTAATLNARQFETATTRWVISIMHRIHQSHDQLTTSRIST